MMIVMKAGATEDQVQAVIDRIESCGATCPPLARRGGRP